MNKKILILSLISSALFSFGQILPMAQAQTKLAVDGNLWLTNYPDAAGRSTLFKFDKSADTFSALTVDGDDTIVAVDPDFVWTAGQLGIFKISKQTDAVVGSISNWQLSSLFGNRNIGPVSVAVDADYAWFTYYGANKVIGVNKVTLAVDKIISVTGGLNSFNGIAVDKDSVWVSVDPNMVNKINKLTGAVDASIVVGNYPAGIAVSKNFVWVANRFSQTVSKIDKMTNAVVATIPVGRFSWSQLASIAADASSVWVTDVNDVQFYRIDQVTDAVTVLNAGPWRGVSMYGLALDKDFVWTMDGASGTIYKFSKLTDSLVSATTDSAFNNIKSIGDATGFEYDYSFSIPADTVAPVTTPSYSGAAGQNGWYASDVAVNLTATDNVGGSGVAETRICVDQVNACTPVIGIAATVSGEGINYVRYQSLDNAGNLEALNSSQVKIDKTSPVSAVSAPTVDDFISASPITVSVSAGDSVSGVSSVSINGVAAALTSGTAASGIWQAAVPATLPVAAGGALTFSAIAVDSVGNSASSPSVIVDNDGISAAIDRNALTNADESSMYSSGFNDGTTFGSITQRGGWNFFVKPAATAGTVEADITGAGALKGKIVSCGNNVETRLAASGDTADLTCGTNSATGLPTTTGTAVRAATAITLREPPTGTRKAILVNLSTGQSATLGSFVLPSSTNTQPVSVEIVDQNDTVLGSGLIAPGQEINIDPNTANGILIENLSSAPLSFTMDGTVIAIASGQTFVDQCPGVSGNAGGTGCPFASKSAVYLDVDNDVSCDVDSKAKTDGGCADFKPLSGSAVKVFESGNFRVKDERTEIPDGKRLSGLFESAGGLIGSCITDVSGSCSIGADHPGHFIVIAKFIDADGKTLYRGRRINFKDKTDRKDSDAAKNDKDSVSADSERFSVITTKFHFEQPENALQKDDKNKNDYHGKDGSL